MPFSHVIAIDWSGAATGSRRKIWLAESRNGSVTRLECGRTREVIAEHLVELAARDPDVIIGLDFAFSLPAWFLDKRGVRNATELWAIASEEAEGWLSACEPPFWGRPRKRKSPVGEEYRLTDRAVPSTNGILPKSVFQIGGAGAVGTGSLRGWPVLHRLRQAGFSIWPFDDPAGPTIIEIYPRLLTGAVVKSSAAVRASHLNDRCQGFAAGIREKAASCDDAFDAVVSAAVMASNREQLSRLRATDDARVKKEGWIWYPGVAFPPRSIHQ